MSLNREKHVPELGDYICPDLWAVGMALEKGDSYVDDSFPGCQFRLPSYYTSMKYPISLTVTGLPTNTQFGDFKSRVKIEFIHDGEQSTFMGGWIFHN